MVHGKLQCGARKFFTTVYDGASLWKYAAVKSWYKIKNLEQGFLKLH